MTNKKPITREEIGAVLSRMSIGQAYLLTKGWHIRSREVMGSEPSFERDITMSVVRKSFGTFVIEVDAMPRDLALELAATFAAHGVQKK